MNKKEKKILITGTSKGVGKSIANKFLKEGFTVIGISRTHSIINDNYLAYTQDLSDLNGFSKVLDKIKNKHDNIYGVISNAGAGLFGKIENISENNLINYFNLNLLSHILLAKKMISNLKRAKHGIFIFIGSEASRIGGAHGTLYTSAKHGLLGFFRSFKLEANKSSVRATIINPGMIRTSFFDNLGFEPGKSKENAIASSDIAEVVYFTFKSSKYINLSDICIDPMKKVIIKKNS